MSVDVAAAFEKLPRRKKEAITLRCAGHSIEKISDLMFCSPNSVKEHLRLVYKRLEVKGVYRPSKIVCRELGEKGCFER
jgi:DNA-binding NarL/FixJ family response regulator